MIRGAGSEDIGGILALEEACFADSWTEGLLAAGITYPYDSYLVTEEEGRIVGYGVLRTLGDECEIQRIAVRPECRRRGYARELLEHMVSLAIEKQACSVILEVRVSNRAAISLYKTFDFQEEGLRRGYYQNPVEDAMLMRRSLA